MSQYSPTVQNALSYHQKGDYEKAKLLYVEALEKNAYDAQALQLLGLLLFLEEEYASAIHLIGNSINIDPTIYEAHNNLGHIYQSLHEYEKALKHYKDAIGLKPEKALAHNNIATVYKHQKKYSLALKHLETAIECNIEYTEAYLNLANLYTEMNDFFNVEQTYKKVLRLKKFPPEVFLKLGKTLQVIDKAEEISPMMSEYLKYNQQNYEVQTTLAIYSWIEGQSQQCSDYLKAIRLTEFDMNRPSDRFVMAYKSFMQSLLNYKAKEPLLFTSDTSLPVLYVIGDSHCLSYANLKFNYKGKIHRVVSKIIIGCKAWHLSQSDNNQYKEQFKNMIANLEMEAEVLVILGEIDCRSDEGILKHYETNPSDLRSTIPVFIKRYVDFITDICARKKIKPLYSLVPAPVFDARMGSDKKDQLKNVIEIFNVTLQSLLPQLSIYDTYSITVNKNGESHRNLHIDKVHLLPQAITTL